MNDKQKEFLEDTRDILINYDGCHTVEELKGLIDETRDRLSALLYKQIDEYENYIDEVNSKQDPPIIEVVDQEGLYIHYLQREKDLFSYCLNRLDTIIKVYDFQIDYINSLYYDILKFVKEDFAEHTKKDTAILIKEDIEEEYKRQRNNLFYNTAVVRDNPYMYNRLEELSVILTNLENNIVMSYSAGKEEMRKELVYIIQFIMITDYRRDFLYSIRIFKQVDNKKGELVRLLNKSLPDEYKL